MQTDQNPVVPSTAEPAKVAPTSAAPPMGQLDFDSDEPLPVCPLRSNGDEVCESCQ